MLSMVEFREDLIRQVQKYRKKVKELERVILDENTPVDVLVQSQKEYDVYSKAVLRILRLLEREYDEYEG